MASRKARTPSNLRQQSLSKLVVRKFPALSPKVISRHATINSNIGNISRKSPVLKATSRDKTIRFKNELMGDCIVKLERLSNSVIRMYSERTKEKYDYSFFEKFKQDKRKHANAVTTFETPLSKKRKSHKQDLKEYPVEQIFDFRFHVGKEYFFIKWEDWDSSENTWEPIQNLDNCPNVLKQYLFEEELKNCIKIEQLKKEISFDSLLSDESLLKRLDEFEEQNLPKLKENLILKMLSMIYLQECEEFFAGDLVQETRNILQLYVLCRKRCHQLMALKNWEEYLNQVDTCKKLIVENNVDLTGPPENFTYINESIPSSGVVIPNEPPISCECKSCNYRSKSCCGMESGSFAYTTKRRIRVASGTPIFECNKTCNCSSKCHNRVVQQGRNLKLTIFRTGNGCGWGVKSDQKIKKGQFLCQYVGEIITFDEAEKRGREYDANGLTYLFDLDFYSVENPYVIDACHLGNVSHFINHSCDPNLGVWAVWTDCLDPNLPLLALFTTKDIEAGEELCFDYLQKSSGNDEETEGMQEVDDDSCTPNASEANTAITPVSPVETRSQVRQRNVGMLRNRTECKCGAQKCRNYLF